MDHPLRNCLLFLLLIFSQISLSGENGSPPDLRDQCWAILNDGVHDLKASNRLEAVRALSLLAGERHATTLALHALNDRSPAVRSGAATTLGQLHATSAIPQLKNALSDKKFWLCWPPGAVSFA